MVSAREALAREIDRRVRAVLVQFVAELSVVIAGLGEDDGDEAAGVPRAMGPIARAARVQPLQRQNAPGGSIPPISTEDEISDEGCTEKRGRRAMPVPRSEQRPGTRPGSATVAAGGLPSHPVAAGNGAAPRPASGEKTCTKCGETKPLADFAKHPHTRDRRAGSCRACNKAYDAARYAANDRRPAKRVAKAAPATVAGGRPPTVYAVDEAGEVAMAPPPANGTSETTSARIAAIKAAAERNRGG